MLKKESVKDGISNLLDGTNFNDGEGYRPGLKALQELSIRSPLLENGITKEEVRSFSKKMGLPTAEKPSYACLLTRLPYNYEVKTNELTRIEKAERFLASAGYGNSRVRNHGTIARIELEKEKIAGFMNSQVAHDVVEQFHKLGYEFVTIDLEGYRSGSFDINLTQSTYE